MLVLSRRVNEVVFIDGKISIKVLKVLGDNSVSLGIEAPEDVGIWRGEITDIAGSTMKKKAVKKMPKHVVPVPVNRSKAKRKMFSGFDGKSSTSSRD